MNEEQWKALRSNAEESAEQDYESRASGARSLSGQDVEDVLKTASVDRSTLDKLSSIVRDSGKSNEEKAETIRNTDGLLKLTVSLLGKILE